MSYLMRVELPDVPGSLGRVATAIGEAGGDIEAIEIVEHRSDGMAVDDVLLELGPGTMADSVVSACTVLDGVSVLWISRYAAGGNLFLDLEAVEELTTDPRSAVDRMVELLPVTFRADWAVLVGADGRRRHSTGAAPDEVAHTALDHPARLAPTDENNLVCGAPVVDGDIVVLGRRGGPEFLDSELARLGHLAALAVSIQQASP